MYMLHYIGCMYRVLQTHTYTHKKIRIHTSAHSLQSDGVLAGSWFAVSHQEAGFPAALQLSLSLLPTHTAMVPAWRGEGGGDAKRDSRSLTYSAVTYGDKSDVKLMIGDDCERVEKTDRRNKTHRRQQRFTVIINQTDRYTVRCGLNELTMSKVNVGGQRDK